MASTLTTTTTATTNAAITPLILTSPSHNNAKDATHIPRGSVTSTLNFYQPPSDNAVPFHYVESPPQGLPQENFSTNPQAVLIHDIRGRESNFNLDADAFQALKDLPESNEKDFKDDEHIKAVYYPEVERLLLDNVPGAKKVTLFDHTIRRATPNAHRAPVTRVHVDQTGKSTSMRVRLHDPSDAEELLKGRYRIINVWRPLNGPVQSFPLAFASATGVDPDEDLIAIEHRYPHRTGETAAVKFAGENGKMQFYYWSGMGNAERLFLKCFDSAAVAGSEIGGRVPHTAFEDPRTPEGAKGRESIEVRALVYG